MAKVGQVFLLLNKTFTIKLAVPGCGHKMSVQTNLFKVDNFSKGEKTTHWFKV